MRKRKQLIQKMLGMTLTAILMASCLCQSVYAAEVDQTLDATQTGSVVIHKYVEDDYLDTATDLTEEEIAAYIQEHPDELKPLEGVQFRYIKVADIVQYAKRSEEGNSVVKIGYRIDDTTAAFLGLDSTKADTVDGQNCYDAGYLDEMLNRKSASETESFVASQDAAFSEATNADGTTTIPDLDLGLYLICEYVYPATTLADANHCAPFFISLPSTDLNEDADFCWNYTVEVMPKNILENIRNDKVIIGTDGDETKEYDSEIGESVEFLIRSELPNASGKLNTYKIIDTLSEGLTYDPSSVAVHAVSDDGQRTPLAEGKGYNFDDINELCWSFHTANLTDNDGWATYDCIEIRYTAQLNENAVVGQDGNPNTVKTVYSKHTNTDTDESLETITPKDPARLFTYALQLHKVGSDTLSGMSGVTFELQDKDGNIMNVTEQAPGQYCVNPAGTATLTTDKNGDIYVKGLEADTYYLRETATNNPLYSLLIGKIKVAISSNECSYTTSATGTYAPADPEQTYYTDSIRQTNYFILPEHIQPSTFVSFGVTDVMTQDGESVEMYEQDQLSWTANFTMGDRDDGKDSGVVKLEVINSKILLPATGGDGDFLAIVIGACVIIAGIILFALTFVRKRSNKKLNAQERETHET